MVRLLLSGVCLMCLPAHAQNYLPPTELAIEAISQQAEVLAADERVQAAQAQANALAVGSYEFEATLIPQRRRTNAGQSFDEFEVQVGRPLRLPGKAPLDREIGARSRTISSLARNEVAHDAAHRLLDLWMNWLRATATDEEARAQLQSLRTEHASLARRVELGDASQLDLDLISAELAQARATALQSEALANAAKHALNTDFPQISLPSRAPSLPDPEPLAGTSDAWQGRIVSDSYQLEAVEQDAARQDAMAARAQADRIPDPNVGVRFFNERDGQERAVGLVFTMPLGGRHRRELANAERAQARALHREIEVVKRTLARDAHWKVALSTDALAQWRAQHDAHTAMRAAAGRTHRAWELGETGLAERLLAARREREMAYQELAARAAAHEAQLRVRIDSHDLWHAAPHEGDE
jgi:outer membrane protein TolC